MGSQGLDFDFWRRTNTEDQEVREKVWEGEEVCI